MADPVRQAIASRLTGAPGLVALLPEDGLYHRAAPADAGGPFVVFARQSGTPRYLFRQGRMDTQVWLIKAVDESHSATRAEQIHDQIEAAMQDAPLQVPDQTTLWCRVDSLVDYDERAGGRTWQHVGALYRITTEPA